VFLLPRARDEGHGSGSSSNNDHRGHIFRARSRASSDYNVKMGFSMEKEIWYLESKRYFQCLLPQFLKGKKSKLVLREHSLRKGDYLESDRRES